jgi:hypothetical protein
MKLIYDIYRKLRNQEKRKIKHQIKHAAFKFEKVGVLFDLVTRYEEKEESFYSQKLYGKEPDNTFRVSKSRLKRMMENVLIEDKSLMGYESEAVNVLLQSRKKLLQSFILLGRGSYQNGKNLLLQVISNAKKMDLEEERFQAELLLYRSQIIKSSVKDFEKQTHQLLELNKIRSQVAEAQILHYSIKNLLNSRTLDPTALAEVRVSVDRIKDIVEETDHPSARYVYFLSEIYYYQVTDQAEKAYEFCTQYLELIQHTPSQYTSQRVALAHTQLAQVSLKMGKLDASRKSALEMRNMHQKDEINYLRGLELSFLVAYYVPDFGEAKALIAQAQEHPQFETAKILAANWHYFEACLLFEQKEFRLAYQKLNDTTPLLADKYGMNVYIRLLEIMILFELQHDDLLDTKILNMRQFIKRTRKNDKQTRPYQLVQLLMQWYKHEYDFERAVDFLEKQTDRQTSSPYSSSELVKFEDWLRAKN